jgi:hypothetical protein
MTEHSRGVLLLALCALATGVVGSASAATYRVVAYMTSQNSEPLGIAEASPGMFFVQASAALIFSLTTQGTATTVAAFPDPPNIVESAPGTTAANSLFYSSIKQVASSSGNVVSVSSTAGSEHRYPSHGLVMTPAGGQPTEGQAVWARLQLLQRHDWHRGQRC